MGLLGSYTNFIADGAIYGKVRQMVAEAKDTLIIVSPYVDLTDDYVREMEKAALQRKVDVQLIFRREMLAKYQQTDWFERFSAAGIFMGTVDRLHSKLYVNEKEVLLTSMNFNRSSGEHSFEVGVVFEQDHKVVDGVAQYIEDLDRHIEEVPGRAKPARRQRRFTRGGSGARVEKQEGHCIRCATSIPLNLKKPYCGSHYESWAKFKNADYPDKHCHVCGREHPATMNRPRCDSCYRRAA